MIFYYLFKNILKNLLFNDVDNLSLDIYPMKIKYFDMWKARYFKLFWTTVNNQMKFVIIYEFRFLD